MPFCARAGFSAALSGQHPAVRLPRLSAALHGASKTVTGTAVRLSGSATATRCTISANWCAFRRSFGAVISPDLPSQNARVGACAMRSRETARGLRSGSSSGTPGSTGPVSIHRPSGPGLPDGGWGSCRRTPDLLGAWIADDVCACEAFFSSKAKAEVGTVRAAEAGRAARVRFSHAPAGSISPGAGGWRTFPNRAGRRCGCCSCNSRRCCAWCARPDSRGVSAAGGRVRFSERYPETVRRLKACVEGCDGRARAEGPAQARRIVRSPPRSRTRFSPERVSRRPARLPGRIDLRTSQSVL